MLVTIDEIGTPSENRFETIKLASNLFSHHAAIKSPEICITYQRRQGQVKFLRFGRWGRSSLPGHGFREVQMQAQLNTCLNQGRRIGRKCRAFTEATGCAEPALFSQAYDACVYGMAHAKIVGAKDRSFHCAVCVHKPSFGNRCIC